MSACGIPTRGRLSLSACCQVAAGHLLATPWAPAECLPCAHRMSTTARGAPAEYAVYLLSTSQAPPERLSLDHPVPAECCHAFLPHMPQSLSESKPQ